MVIFSPRSFISRRWCVRTRFTGAGGAQHPDFGDIGDIFETIFGSAFGGGGAGRARGLALV